MEILVNEHVCDTKLNVQNTYLKAMFNLGNSSESLSVKDLVPDQNPKTTSAHIKKAMDKIRCSTLIKNFHTKWKA